MLTSSSEIKMVIPLILVLVIAAANAEFNGHNRPNTGEPGGVIVHLMDWLYDDIAFECEMFLSKGGFGGVQVSPVTEYLVIENSWWETIAKFFLRRPWYPRHQVASYKIDTPSGNEEEFRAMVRRCNKAGIKVYVDVVLNHMTASYPTDNVGCAGSVVDTVNFKYPNVPYDKEDFNQPQCKVDENNATMMRNCEFRQLHDLNQTNPCVRDKMRAFLNKLISFGVAGFRVGNVKYMWPEDLKKLFDHLDYLNRDEGFASETPAYIFQDYFDTDDKSKVKATEYYDTGLVVDHRYAQKINRIFYHNDYPIDFSTIKEKWQLLDSEKSVVFVDTYETQREASYTITHNTYKIYKLAAALMLASPHGQPLITSSYTSKKGEDPPYSRISGKIVPTNQQFTCASRWHCEHRYNYIASMVKFREHVGDAPITNWWHNGRYQFAFSRSKRGFILINNNVPKILNGKFKTDLPQGTYCDIISGGVENGVCTGGKVKVDSEGYVNVAVLDSSDKGQGLLAIHTGAVVNS